MRFWQTSATIGGMLALLSAAGVAQDANPPRAASPAQADPKAKDQASADPTDVPGVGLPGKADRKADGRDVEGVVTKIAPAPKDEADGRVVVTIDTTQTWRKYATSGPARHDAKGEAAVEPKAQTPEEQASRQAIDKEARRKPVEVLVTKGTKIYTFARNDDGEMVQAATASSPGNTAGTGLTTKADPRLVKESNFTNIREGSFVALHSREVADRTVAASLSLIEKPATAGATRP